MIGGSSWEVTANAKHDWKDHDLEVTCRLSGESMETGIIELAQYPIIIGQPL